MVEMDNMLLSTGANTPLIENITEKMLLATDFAYATPSKVWGIGLLFVTLISSCAAVGIMLMPCLSKRTYNVVLTYFIGLGVGSLSGSAIFHLLPQAFDLVDPVVKNPNQTGHSYLWKSWIAVFGVFLFFLVDKLLKLSVEYKKARKSRLNSTSTTDSLSCTNANHDQQQQNQNSTVHNKHHYTIASDGFVPSNGVLNDGNLAKNNNNTDAINHKYNKVNNGDDIVSPTAKCHVTDDSDYKVDLGCGHAHSIIDTNNGKPRSVIATVAWMIIFGDGLHNFIDGLSIGASFSANILQGISISVAVLCEEFPHELGDVAILVASGMTMRQALIYNLLSALTCYLGFVIGVVVGEMREVSFYIFALAAGCFLYISLGNMINEMNKEMDRSLDISIRKAMMTLTLQTLGIMTGLVTMFIMAYFGSNINFA